MPNGAVERIIDAKLEDLRKSLPQVEVDNETLYVAEGDLLMDDVELEQHAQRQAALEQLNRIRLGEAGGVGIIPRPSPALVGVTEGGKIVRWAPDTVLTYAVLRQTFSSADEYDTVVRSMRAATRAWEDTCGVKFNHEQHLDDSASTRPDGVLFPVRGFDSGGQFIAAAFFPNEPAFRRRVLIDPSYFTTSFDLVGVLRHELGHALGFRHEHIRSGAPAECRDEDMSDTIDLTAYDPQSCMHYFCGGVGSRELAITDVDKQGSTKLYGLPLADMRFIKP